jgi:hypothetical protein
VAPLHRRRPHGFEPARLAAEGIRSVAFYCNTAPWQSEPAAVWFEQAYGHLGIEVYDIKGLAFLDDIPGFCKFLDGSGDAIDQMSPHCRTDPATATHSCAGRGFPCPPPVVLDDFGPEALGAGWAEGWYAPCGDAYGGPVRYHHDGAADKGAVSADYFAAGLRPGCWQLEEHHPGANPLCARYLPAEVPLTVHAGLAVHAAAVDQSVGGGRWNQVGRYQLDGGHARLSLSNAGTASNCAAGSCYWVADAFRLSWHGETCGAAPVRLGLGRIVALHHLSCTAYIVALDLTWGLLAQTIN